jgi:NADPH:quinone reductase-like Zn-dependent oxidoreductase
LPLVRALTLSGHGALDKIEPRDDLPLPPSPGRGEVRIAIKATALNHLDLFVVEGLPGITITPPWIVGCDAAGIVDETGADVDNVRTGDHVIIDPGISDGTCEFCVVGEQPLCPRYRILGEHVPGLCAEYVTVPADNAYRIPESIPWERAAAFTLATLTAWRMVVTRARVTKEDDVLIWGIGGGVAQQALQICRNIGAHVWVTSGSADKLARAKALGADEVLNHGEVDVGREIRARTGKRGVSVVIDNVGRDTWKSSLAALGRAGRLVTCGATSGPIVETDVRRLFWNQWNIMGSTMGNRAEMMAISGELSRGRLLPEVDSVFDLEDGRAAYERLQAGSQFGKVVIRVAR